MAKVYRVENRKANVIKRIIDQTDLVQKTITLGVDEIPQLGFALLLSSNNRAEAPAPPSDPDAFPSNEPVRYSSFIKLNGDGSVNVEISFDGNRWFKVPNNALLSDIFGEDVIYNGQILARKENSEDPDTDIYVCEVALTN